MQHCKSVVTPTLNPYRHFSAKLNVISGLPYISGHTKLGKERGQSWFASQKFCNFNFDVTVEMEAVHVSHMVSLCG